LKKRYFSSISSENFKNIESPLNIHDVKDSWEEMPKNPDFNSLDEETKDSLLTWSKNGYAIIKGFFSEQEVNSYNEEIENLIENKKVKYRYGNKIMFAIHYSDILRNTGNNKKLLKILKLLMGKRIELFQSINFLKGSQQRTHSDSIHMTTFPYGNLIAVWIALEDISEECGPLNYYPGSHKLPYIMNRDYDNIGSRFRLGNKTYSEYEDYIERIVVKNRLEKKVFTAIKGDILIWHANLLHGGNKVIDKNSSRKSMVFHYYSDNSTLFNLLSSD